MQKLRKKDLVEYFSGQYTEEDVKKITNIIWKHIKLKSLDFNNYYLANELESVVEKDFSALKNTRNSSFYVILEALNILDEGAFGVECIECRKKEILYYLNTGDTYSTTILHWKDNFYIGCYGDFIDKYYSKNNV